ncbi:MAG: hypothetical protein FWD93_05710 [Coriobacteriia bacterium]|nr:hypothetical protein [Coriobacteriia bacterium]
MFLLTLSNFASPNSIRNSITPDLTRLVDQGNHPIVFGNAAKYSLDRHTDAIMMNMAIPDRSLAVLEGAILAPVYDHLDEGGNSRLPVESLAVKVLDTSVDNNAFYLTYWHGYLVPLRAVLTVTSFFNIILLNFVLLTMLFAVVLEIFRRVGGWPAIPAMFIAFIFAAGWLIPQSVQYANMFYLGLIATIALYLLLRQEKKIIWLACFFLATGMATSFFDFLTTPIITLIAPLTLLVMWEFKHQRQSVFKVVGLTISWAFGYIVFWILKWLVALQVHSPDFVNAMFNNSFSLRSGISEESGIMQRVEAIRRNIYQLAWSPGPMNEGDFLSLRLLALIVVVAVVIWLAILLLARLDLRRLSTAAPLLLLALAPYLWYFAISNHSYVHSWFTYRSQAVSIFATIMFIVLSIDWQNLSRRALGLGKVKRSDRINLRKNSLDLMTR